MELAAVIDQLGLQAQAEALSQRWDESQQTPAGSQPAAAEPLQSILRPERLAAACATLELSDSARERAQIDARRIAGDPALSALARYVRYALFDCPDYPRASI
ncbi:MAG TPA: hypothetical protein VFK80_01625, partial [Limnochordia bacterium]|nr:hypothetical protein [Limnochordia bacterium]